MSIYQAIRIPASHSSTLTSAVDFTPKNFSLCSEVKITTRFTSEVLGASTLHYPSAKSFPSAAPTSSLASARLFGPEKSGGLPEAPAFEKVWVKPGQNLADVALEQRSTPHEIAAASGIDHFFVSPEQTLTVPGPRLRTAPDFQAVAVYYKNEYQKFEGRVEVDASLNPATRPDLPGTRLASSANYQKVATPQGYEFKSTQIELDPAQAQLRRELEKAFNAEQVAQESKNQSVPALVRTVRDTHVETSGFGLRIGDNGVRLEPLRVELDPVQAQQQQEAAQRHSEALYGKGGEDSKGRKDELTLTENRWDSAFSNNSALLYGALSLGADALGIPGTQRWAEGKRVHHEHQAAMADARAQMQGAVTHSAQIETSADFMNWLTGHAQNMVPMLLTMAPGAALGGVALGSRAAAKVGGVVFSYPHSVGSMARAQQDHSGATHAGSAFGLGVLHAGVNYFGLVGAVMGVQPFRNRWVALDGFHGLSGGVMRAASTGTTVAPKEALIGVTQMLTEQLGRLSVDPGETFWNPRSQAGAKEALYVGAVFGFVGGAGFGGWQRSGKPVAVDERASSAQASAQTTTQASIKWRALLEKLLPEGGFNLWPEAGIHPGALFNWATPQPYAYALPMSRHSFVVEQKAALAETWNRLSPNERTMRQQHVMDLLMETETLTHRFLLDRLSSVPYMQYKNIAQRHGVTEKQVQNALNGLANKLSKQKVKGDVSGHLEQQLAAVLGPEQTAIGLAYVLNHHFDDLVGAYYAPVVRLENTKINLSEARALQSGLDIFDPKSGRLLGFEKPGDSSLRSEALKKLNLRSLSDAERRYPDGVEGLKQALDRHFKKLEQTPAPLQKKRDEVLSILMSQSDRSLTQLYLYMNGVPNKEIASITKVSRGADVLGTVRGIAARLKLEKTNKAELNAHLSHVFVEGETGVQLLDRVVNRFDEFATTVLADRPVLALSQIRPSAMDIAVVEGILNKVDRKTIAAQLGTTVEAINKKKSKFIQTVAAYSMDDYVRRYPDGEAALREHIRQIKEANFDPARVVDWARTQQIQKAQNTAHDASPWLEIASAPAHTPLQRVLNTLMWARTPVLEDLHAYLHLRESEPHIILNDEVAKNIGVGHGVSRPVLISDLAVLADRMRGTKVDEPNTKKVEALEALLSDVIEPGQTPLQFVKALLDDVNGFSSKYFSHHPIKTLDAAQLSTQELLYLKKALDDPEFSWAFQNVSAVSMFEDATFNQVLRKFNALSMSDLMRRYPDRLQGLSADVNQRVKALGLDTHEYQQAVHSVAAKSVSARDLDFVGTALHAVNGNGLQSRSNGYLDILLAGSLNQVSHALSASKKIDPKIIERDLQPVLTSEQQRVLDVLMQERTLVFDQLRKVMANESFSKVGTADGMSASTTKDLFRKLSGKISGNPDAKPADVRFLLPEIFGSEQSAKTFVELLAYDFETLAQRYLGDRPIRSVHDAGLQPEQKELLKQALASQELLWSFQSRGSDAIVEALGGASIHDVLRRYPGGLDQLRVDLGLPPLNEDAVFTFPPEPNRPALEWAAVKHKVIDGLPRVDLKELNVNYDERIGMGGNTNVYVLKDRPDVVLSILRLHDSTRLEEYKDFIEYFDEGMRSGATLLEGKLKSFNPQEIIEKAAYTHHVFSSGLRYKNQPLAPQVYGIVEKDGLAIGYLMEKIEGQTLNDAAIEFKFSDKKYEAIEAEAMRQLVLLRKHGLTHSDVDPVNIIFSFDQDGNDVVRLIDFEAPVLSTD